MPGSKPFMSLGLLRGATFILGTLAITGAPIAIGVGPAWAQEDGGHEDGGHEDGGHGGGGGKGQGGGQHGKPAPVEEPPPPAVAGVGEATDAAAGRPSRRFPAGTYLRLELGAARGSAGDANWLPPGFDPDPQVFFDLDIDSTAMAGIAIGRSYGNGWRAEAALNMFGSTNFSGPWSYTIPEINGPHADMEGSVRSVALFANGYYDFATGGRATPFVTAGVGVARNTMGDWTRINLAEDAVRRTFQGASNTDFAWSVGLGVALDVGPVKGSAPAKLELTWRYFDLGSVSGGTTPLNGSGSPTEALNFDLSDQVISIGLRIAL